MNGLRISQQVVSFSVAVAVVVVLAFTGAMFGARAFFLLGFAIPACIAAMVCLRRPMIFVGISLLWYSFAFLSSATYFPYLYYKLSFFSRYMDEMLMIPLYFLLLMQFVFKKKMTPPNVIFVWILLIFVTAVSGYFNQSGLKKTLSYEQSYFRHVVLLLIGTMFFVRTEKNYRSVTRLLITVLVIQFVFDVGWLLGINPVPNRYALSGADWAVGTMGLSSYVTYFSVIGLSLSTVTLMDTGALLHKIKWSGMALLSLTLFIFGNTKHAVVMTAVCLVFVVMFASKRRSFPKILFLCLAIGSLIAVAEIYNISFRDRQLSWYSKDRLSTAGTAKVQVHKDVFRTLAEDRAWILGKGPGQFSSVVAFWHTSPLFVRYFYAELEKKRYNPGGSILQYPRTGFLSLVGDIGFLGLFIFLVMCSMVFVHIFRQFRNGAYDKCVWARRLAICWCGWMLFYGMLNCLTDLLNFGITPFLTWAGAGILWHPPADDTNEQADGR